MDESQIAALVLGVLAVAAFVAFLVFASKMRTSPSPKADLEAFQTEGLGDAAKVLEAIAKVAEGLGKLAESFSKAGPAMASLVASLGFGAMALAALAIG